MKTNKISTMADERLQDYHEPVLLKDCIEGLQIVPDGIYADVTFGGGGHSKEIIKHLGPEGKLFVFDQDPDAAKKCLAG